MVRKKKRKNLKYFKYINCFFKSIAAVFYAFFRTITIDLYKNVKLYIIIFTNKEERDKIKKKLDLEKKQEITDKRLERLERLVYAIYNDPTYTKRDEGQYDLKELKIKINK